MRSPVQKHNATSFKDGTLSVIDNFGEPYCPPPHDSLFRDGGAKLGKNLFHYIQCMIQPCIVIMDSKSPGTLHFYPYQFSFHANVFLP